MVMPGTSLRRAVYSPYCDLRRDCLVEALHLRQADRRLEIGHAVIEPDVVMDETTFLSAPKQRLRFDLTRSHSSRSFVMTIPPSPVVNTLFG